jgi:group I intron endonuclease
MGDGDKFVIIYKITNTKNEMIYIGQTKLTLAIRKSSHLGDSKRNRKNKVASSISIAIKEYGVENFIFEVLETVEKDMADSKEAEWISKLKSNDPSFGYNIMSGKRGNHSSISKDKTSKSINESLNSMKLRGLEHWNKGKKPSEEKKKIISEKLRGVPCPKRGHLGDKNPMKNPLTVAKMLETRRINRLIKKGNLLYGN